MNEAKLILEPGIDDIAIDILDSPAQAIAQGVDGSLFRTYKGTLYRHKPDGSVAITSIDDAYRANILAFDHAGHLYYAGKHTGELRISLDYGETFTTCLTDANGDCFRGFAVDNEGRIFVGSYAKEGPASLYFSPDDGKSWTSIRTFRCRHIHDVAVNPYNNWLYVVAGERKPPHALDAYRIFRSKDGGESWDAIVQPVTRDDWHTRRPLYLGIGFIRDTVVLSTDHCNDENGIDCFIDDGSSGPFSPRRKITTPNLFLKDALQSYCWRFSSFHGYLYTVCAGGAGSILYRTRDGANWQKIAELDPLSGNFIEFGKWQNALHLSGGTRAYRLRLASDQGARSNKGIRGMDPGDSLLKHDKRFEKDLCSGYFHRSLADDAKYQKLYRILADNKIAKDAKIADFGCGVGRLILNARSSGYTNIVGIEANPRWLIALRRIYEEVWPEESPRLALAQRGQFSLVSPDYIYNAVFAMGVFCGDGYGLDPEASFEIVWNQLGTGGLFCFNIQPERYGQTGPDAFIGKLIEIGFRNAHMEAYFGSVLITVRKPT